VENYVLSQFGEHLTIADFADIRRSVDIDAGAPVTANDFLLAMLLRLGQVRTSDWKKCRRLFSKLDRFGFAYQISFCDPGSATSLCGPDSSFSCVH
jgi:hypothetical protein